jgi:hypothetical protein
MRGPHRSLFEPRLWRGFFFATTASCRTSTFRRSSNSSRRGRDAQSNQLPDCIVEFANARRSVHFLILPTTETQPSDAGGRGGRAYIYCISTDRMITQFGKCEPRFLRGSELRWSSISSLSIGTLTIVRKSDRPYAIQNNSTVSQRAASMSAANISTCCAVMGARNATTFSTPD